MENLKRNYLNALYEEQLYRGATGRANIARNKLKNASARIIQKMWRNKQNFQKKQRYMLVFNRGAKNRYTRPVKNMLSKYQFYAYPNNAAKKVFLLFKNTSKGKKVSRLYKNLKNRLPNNMLPKIEKINIQTLMNKLNLVTSKVTLIQRTLVPLRKVVHWLNSDGDPNIRHAAKIMLKLNKLATQFSQYINATNPNIQQIKNTVSRNIGLCHINTTLRNNPSVNKASYLVYYRNQMLLACKQIAKMNERTFIRKFKIVLGDRPCIENIVDALTQVAFGEVEWRGVNKALNLSRNNNVQYLKHDIISTFMQKHHKTIRKNGNMSEYTKNRLWNAIKNRPLYVWTNNGPVFKPVKNISNTRKLSNNAFNEYINYLNP